jgi:hypothetical protein
MYQILGAHFEKVKDVRIVDLFKADVHRPEKYTLRLEAGGEYLHLDISKNIVSDETLKLLGDLAEEKKVNENIQKMFAGVPINVTEKRSVLHVALHNRSSRPILVDGKDVMPDVHAVLDKMRVFTEQVRSGEWKGFTGKPITDVVNIGIGGSDLGPLMVSLALTPYADPKKLRTHYISNVDGTHAAEVLKLLNPETCMFIISSKTFTTQVCLASFFTSFVPFLYCRKQCLMQEHAKIGGSLLSGKTMPQSSRCISLLSPPISPKLPSLGSIRKIPLPSGIGLGAVILCGLRSDSAQLSSSASTVSESYSRVHSLWTSTSARRPTP